MSEQPIPGTRPACAESTRAAPRVPYLVLHPGRFSMPRFLRCGRWSLKPPFHPYPHLSARAVSSLWHCLSATPCVVTSRVYLRPDRSYAAPRPMEFGLSSRDFRRERPSALPRRLQSGGWLGVWRDGSFSLGAVRSFPGSAARRLRTGRRVRTGDSGNKGGRRQDGSRRRARCDPRWGGRAHGNPGFGRVSTPSTGITPEDPQEWPPRSPWPPPSP